MDEVIRSLVKGATGKSVEEYSSLGRTTLASRLSPIRASTADAEGRVARGGSGARQK